MNQELDQYLWLFVNERQDDWYDLLPMVEFQHNNHVHSVRGHLGWCLVSIEGLFY